MRWQVTQPERPRLIITAMTRRFIPGLSPALDELGIAWQASIMVGIEMLPYVQQAADSRLSGLGEENALRQHFL